MKCGTTNQNRMTKDTTLLTYPSIFKRDVNVNIFFKEDESYGLLMDFFKHYGVGFLEPNSKTIILDGESFINNSEVNIDDVRMVEAHEVSHIILQHKGGDRSPKDELEADLGAYLLLKKHGISTDRLIDMFRERHNVDFSEELLTKVEGRI